MYSGYCFGNGDIERIGLSQLGEEGVGSGGSACISRCRSPRGYDCISPISASLSYGITVS
jgi:hypothetical protein